MPAERLLLPLHKEPFSFPEAGAKRRWKQFEGPAAEISSAVNDAYLKANRQEEGVKSYGRMVDLLLAEQRAAAKEDF